MYSSVPAIPHLWKLRKYKPEKLVGSFSLFSPQTLSHTRSLPCTHTNTIPMQCGSHLHHFLPSLSHSLFVSVTHSLTHTSSLPWPRCERLSETKVSSAAAAAAAAAARTTGCKKGNSSPVPPSVWTRNKSWTNASQGFVAGD